MCYPNQIILLLVDAECQGDTKNDAPELKKHQKKSSIHKTMKFLN